MAKVALLIGISQYEFDLNALSAPDKDAKAMQQVLENKEVCDFTEVKLLINPHHQEMAEAIELLFRERKKDDLVLLYFSGHGLKDEAGNLYLTNSQTKSPGGTLLTATAISAHFIQDLMNKSRSRRQVVILDCCFSGAFGQGLSPKDDGSINIKNQLGGEGRAILTSSGCIQYSYEQKGSDLSIYTNHFIEGLKTGAADQDGDGDISINDLHEYARDKVQQAAPAMKPELYVSKEGFKILLAKAPTGDPKLKYRKAAEKYAHQGKFSSTARRILNRQRAALELQIEEAEAIESDVLQPYREYEANLEEYQEAFVDVIEHEYPLCERTRNELKDLQQLLSLRDEDVEPIEQSIISERGFSDTNQPRQSSSTPPLSHSLESDKAVNYTQLEALLQAGKWREADQETKAIMLEVSGFKQEGRLSTDCIRNFPCQDLNTIDQLWIKYSKGKFGFSVQQPIWQSLRGDKAPDNETWRNFSRRVGWYRDNYWVSYKDLTFSLEALQGHLPYCREWIEKGWQKHTVGRFDALASRLLNCNGNSST
jgi:uncharacterized caspase-like protein